MEERIIIQGVCSRIKLIVESGHLMLTNQRFIYSKHGFLKIALIGVLVNLTKGDFDFDIPIQDIKDISRGRHGLSKSILVITTHDGKKYKFMVTKFQEWEIACKNILSGNMASTDSAKEQSNADEIAKYKQLLDSGAITQEEYDIKKKQLLEI